MAQDPVTGWKLPPEKRARLLELDPPPFAILVADHVTLRPRKGGDTPLSRETSAAAVRDIDDGEGVQALVVEIGGSTARGDGGTYHITWSLAAGREAQESNDFIARLGWRPLSAPVPITPHPGGWRRGGH